MLDEPGEHVAQQFSGSREVRRPGDAALAGLGRIRAAHSGGVEDSGRVDRGANSFESAAVLGYQGVEVSPLSDGEVGRASAHVDVGEGSQELLESGRDQRAPLRDRYDADGGGEERPGG